MTKAGLPMFALILLAGCVTAGGVPAYGRLADKNKTFLQGDWSNDVLSLQDVSGFHCSGNYSSGPFESITTNVALQCSDGRVGRLLLTRNSDEGAFFDLKKKRKKNELVAYGQGSLSDGTKFDVFLGQMKGSMRAPSMVK